MSKNTVTPEQIQEWKDKHGDLFELPIEDKKLYLRAPKMNDFKAAMSALIKCGEVSYTETLSKLLAVGGDVEILMNDEYFSVIQREMQSLMNFDDPEIEVLSNGQRRFIINGKEVVVRKPTREDLRKADQQNPSNKPFITQEKLFDLIKIKADDFFSDKDNAEARFQLYKGIELIQKEKFGQLKKL
ncbi:hypothetical protein ACTS9D_00855 [Empedobacter brevis]